MANFSTPFAQSGPRRNPTADERANGFPCGAADLLLFNGLFHRIEAELGNLITFAGLTPTDNTFDQVRQAIAALIDAATGGGDTESYLLLSQASARLPIFPEVLSTTGRLNVTSPADGTVRVPGGVTILHRGISPYVTVEEDFATVSSRTYHLRWTPADGPALKWLGDSGYNPGGLLETDPSFDSVHDDALLARVVTNSSNVATITTLANKDRLFKQELIQGADIRLSGLNGSNGLIQSTLDWGRSPRNFSTDLIRALAEPVDTDINFVDPGAVNRNNLESVTLTAAAIPITRYTLNTVVVRDASTAFTVNFNAAA